MRIVTFASGSGGNCTLLSSDGRHILLDCGISMRRISCALLRQGLDLGHISAILVTHEHSDHIAALPMLLKKRPLPVYAPRTVANALRRRITDGVGYIRDITPGEPFAVGNLTVTAFPTPHDTDESVGYRIEDGVSFGFCTDTGHVSDAMRSALRGCRSVVIEANHDLDRLRYGPYPAALKLRVMSERGHLSNPDCAGFACYLAQNGTKQITLGHLSKENNTPALARDTVRSALNEAGFADVELRVALPDGDVCWEIPPC